MSLFSVKFSLEESIDINAGRKDIWDLLVDAKKAKQWSPWLILEPECEHSTDGIIGELGYKEQRSGKYIGEGEGILKSVEKEKFAQFELNFFKPFKSLGNIAEFYLDEKPDGEYRVIWKMIGLLPVFLFFMKKSMSRLIAADFKRGLVMLKDLAENKKLETSTHFVGTDTFGPHKYIGIKGAGNQEEMEQKMGTDFQTLTAYVESSGIDVQGAFSIYDKSDIINNHFEYTACLLIGDEDFTKISNTDLKDNIITGKLNATKVAKITHKGDYKYLGNSWTGGFMFLKPEGLKHNKKISPFEFYEVGNHNSSNPAEYLTHIGIPIK